MNLRALTIVILLSGCALTGYYFWRQHVENEEANSVVTPLSSALGKEVPLITIEHSVRDNPAALTVINIDTPKINILSDHTAADRANAYISRFIDDTLGRFNDESRRGAGSLATSSAMINTFTLNAKILLATPRIVTIAFTESTMLAQILHPEKFVRYITFDLMHAKVVESKDLFVGTDAMTLIASQLAKLDSAKGLSLEQISQSLLRDDQHALTKEGLLVSVDTETDSVTHTRSSREFALPLNTIDSYISEEIKRAVLTGQENIRMAEPEIANASNTKQ